MTRGEWNCCHGITNTDPTAAIMPPRMKVMCLGETLAKSKAGETKLATMLMPMVAMMKVAAPSTAAVVLSTRATISTGSCRYSPKTGSVAEVVMTVTMEKARKLTGRPQKLPFLTALISVEKREKSLKLTIGPEKYDTTSEVATIISQKACQPVYLTSPSVRLMLLQPAL